MLGLDWYRPALKAASQPDKTSFCFTVWVYVYSMCGQELSEAPGAGSDQQQLCGSALQRDCCGIGLLWSLRSSCTGTSTADSYWPPSVGSQEMKPSKECFMVGGLSQSEPKPLNPNVNPSFKAWPCCLKDKSGKSQGQTPGTSLAQQRRSFVCLHSCSAPAAAVCSVWDMKESKDYSGGSWEWWESSGRWKIYIGHSSKVEMFLNWWARILKEFLFTSSLISAFEPLQREEINQNIT